jgi:hypothetical protein
MDGPTGPKHVGASSVNKHMWVLLVFYSLTYENARRRTQSFAPTVLYYVSVPSLSVKISSLKIGPTRSTETSVLYQHTLRNISEDDIIQVNHSGSLRSRTVALFSSGNSQSWNFKKNETIKVLVQQWLEYILEWRTVLSWHTLWIHSKSIVHVLSTIC